MSENNNKCNICGESSPYYECSSCIAKDPYIPISKIKELIEEYTERKKFCIRTMKNHDAAGNVDSKNKWDVMALIYGMVIEDLNNLINEAEGKDE